MIRPLLSLCLILHALSGITPAQETGTVLAMKTGVLLRMHVVAQDDSEDMQSLKLHVRDAVRGAYADAPPAHGTSMLRHTRALLPALTRAARDAARDWGYTGAVRVTIEQAEFDRRTLDGLIIPAGSYPALMIRLGDAHGHNWWGLIAPDLALSCARTAQGNHWDWSLEAFLRALFGFPAEVNACE